MNYTMPIFLIRKICKANSIEKFSGGRAYNVKAKEKFSIFFLGLTKLKEKKLFKQPHEKNPEEFSSRFFVKSWLKTPAFDVYLHFIL
jgi:hypothetical protein